MWNIFGRGFDSRRLHQASFETKEENEACHGVAKGEAGLYLHSDPQIRFELRPGKPNK